MAFRFFRRFRIAPGVTLNLSKSGASLSAGPRGAKVTVGSRGVRRTLGLPGTGLYYTEHTSWNKTGGRAGDRRPAACPPVTAPPPESLLNPGFFKRLFISEDERDFIDGLKAFTAGDQGTARIRLSKVLHIADAAFLSGFIALRQEAYDQAIDAFEKADQNHESLGRHFGKYGLTLNLMMPITDELDAHIQPTRRGLWLGLVEALQEKQDYLRAATILRSLRDMYPDDIVVKISLAELLLEVDPANPTFCNEIVRMSADATNASATHAVLLLYKARALRALGTLVAARDTLTAALRRTKDRSAELLLALRYERALVYTNLSQAGRARSDLEKIYAAAPEYEDVRRRLGL